jgi:hypothetical protein
MSTLRVRVALLVATALLPTAGSARADVDMTGRWFTVIGVGLGGLPRCTDVTRTGTDLVATGCLEPFSGNGTIDSATGAFTWQEGQSYVTGTVAPDGHTFTGTYFRYHCTFVGCTHVPFDFFGSRCRGGTLDAGEDCDVGPDPTGTCCTTECTFAAEGTACDADADPGTSETCDAAGSCRVPPCEACRVWDHGSASCVPDVRADCLGALDSRVTLTTDAPSASWAWTGDSSTTPADFGAPDTDTALEACVFAADGATLLLATVVPAGGTCGTRPCWSANGTRTRHRYRNSRGVGIQSLKLARRDDGTAKIRLSARGPMLGVPPTLAGTPPPVTVQLRRLDAPRCWQATFPVLQASTSTRLRARDGH